MKLALAALVLLFAAAAFVLANPVLHCGKIIPKQSATGCVVAPDGHSATCHLGDIAPSAWGSCVEGQDETWTCLFDGFISHYNSLSIRTWRIKADSCPTLRDQIRGIGEGPQHPLPPLHPQLPVVKEESKELRT